MVRLYVPAPKAVAAIVLRLKLGSPTLVHTKEGFGWSVVKSVRATLMAPSDRPLQLTLRILDVLIVALSMVVGVTVVMVTTLDGIELQATPSIVLITNLLKAVVKLIGVVKLRLEADAPATVVQSEDGLSALDSHI